MSRIYSFQDIRIDPAHRELRRGGEWVDLPPHVFDFLVYLLERNDRAVSRDELVAAVWGKTEVSDTLLGQTVLRARRELGDDAKSQAVLRTIPRFGYRWMASVQISDGDALASVAPWNDTASPGPVASPADETAPSSRRRARWPIAAAALILAALIAGIATVRRHEAPPRTSLAGPTSAVLPAELQADAEWSWLRLAVMDVVAGRLRSSGVPSVPGEDVISLLRAPSADVRGAIRSATTASLLLTPKVRHDGAAWLVTLESDNGDGRRFSASASANDALAAARQATDRLLSQLGVNARNDGESTAQSAFIGQLDAAILADDLALARRLVDDAPTDLRDTTEVRLRLAKIDFRSGKFDAAHDRLQRLLDTTPAADADTRAGILNGLGSVAIRQDRMSDAAADFSQSIELLASGHDAQQLGQAYLGRANVAAEQGQSDAAMADYARAREAFRDAADARSLARVGANEGFLDLGRNRPASALPALRKAAEEFRRWGAANESIYASIGVITANLALLDNAAAMRAADEAADLDRQIDNPDTHGSFALARIRALAAVGRLREAQEALDALRSANTGGDVIAAMASGLFAKLELEQNHPESAEALAAKAVETLTATGYANDRADAWLTQARAALRDPHDTRAAALSSAFGDWAQAGSSARARFLAQLARAEVAAQRSPASDPTASDAAPEWHRAFDAARELAAKDGVPSEIAAVAASYATALLAHAELDAAAVEIGRVSRWSDGDFRCALLEAQLHAARGDSAGRDAALARVRALAGERPIPVPLTPKPLDLAADESRKNGS